MSRKINEAVAREAFERAITEHTQEFGRYFLARLLGLEISHPDDDTCVVEFEVHDFMFNPQGSLHGGLIATVLDVSMGHLLQKSIGPGMTLEMKTQFLRPARVGRLRAEGRFLKKGKSINYLETRLTDAKGSLLAVANSTWQLIPQAAASA